MKVYSFLISSYNTSKMAQRSCMGLALFFSMFLFDSHKNIRKPMIFFDVFTGDQNGTLRRKALKTSDYNNYPKYSFSVSLLLTKTLVLSVHSKVPLGVIHRPWSNMRHHKNQHFFCLGNFRQSCLIKFDISQQSFFEAYLKSLF